jgi:hypothetical protein
MPNLDELLNRIRQKPGLYIGSSSAQYLHMFLEGYISALRDYAIPPSEQELLFRKFPEWLQARERVYTSASWAKIILLNSSNEEHAFYRFFELYDEFKAAMAK